MKKLFPFYPLLLGAIWVIATYSANRVSLPSFSVVIIPTLVITGIITAIFGITQLMVKDWKKSALIVTIIFCLTVAHGYVRDHIDIVGIKAAPIWIVLMGCGIVAIVKLTRERGRIHLTIFGNVICTTILVISLFFAFSSPSIATPKLISSPVPINNSNSTLPDVYYIIPDTYTCQFILQTYLNYDDTEFLNFLRSRGFSVNDTSYANYHHSLLSISSVMNMRYWTDEELGSHYSYALGQHLLQNPVGDTFKEAGYTYIHMGSWWGFTSTNIAADTIVQFSNMKELDFTLYRTTIWYDILDYLFDAGGNRILRDAHLNQFKHLVEVSRMEESTFTFCHLILPHPPFLFDSEGNHVSGWVLSSDEWRRMYLDQLTYTNKLLEDTIDEILVNSKVTPIIIISSDEGYADAVWQDYFNRFGIENMVEDVPNLVRMRQGNILAVLNPYGDTPSSPVNIFRCVLNSLFSSNLEYLPDKYFLRSLKGNGSDFIDITEFING